MVNSSPEWHRKRIKIKHSLFRDIKELMLDLEVTDMGDMLRRLIRLGAIEQRNRIAAGLDGCQRPMRARDEAA